MPAAHNMSLQKNVYSPGKWYPYFYLPPKSPEMSLYFKLVETELTRLYRSFLPKDQIHGKVLDFLGIPNVGGKIQKSKLHKIFIFETSAKGKKLLARQENQVKEVKLYPPQSKKPFEGPFKFFVSKNSRKLSEVAGRQRSRDCGFTEPHATSASTSPDEKTSHVDEPHARYIPPESKTKVGSLRGCSKPDSREPVKPYHGPYRFFKSKNSRTVKESLDVPANGSSAISARNNVLKEEASPILMISDSSDDSDVQFVPHRSKIKGDSSRKSQKQEPKQRRHKFNSQVQKKVVRNRKKTSNLLWYENTLSSESSKSYSVESDEDFAVKLISYENRIENTRSVQNNGTRTFEAGDPQPTSGTRNPNAALGTEKRAKTYTTLSSVEPDNEVDMTIVSKPVMVSKPAAEQVSAHDKRPSTSRQALDQTFNTLSSKGYALDKSFHKGEMTGLPNHDCLVADTAENSQPHLTTSEFPFIDEEMPYDKFGLGKVNSNKKTVEFKNIEYYYYNRDTSSSMTQRSGSSHRSSESKADLWKNDSSSDENDYDTGIVSPMMMSQESQLMSQDMMNQNTARDSRPRDVKPIEQICEKDRLPFPSVLTPLVWPESSGFVDETPWNSPAPNQGKFLDLQDIPKLKYSPSISQQLSSASPLQISDIGKFPADLEVIRRIGSMKSVEDENLSQVSAATEIISARIVVDLRTPGAFEAVEQHCRSIMEAVNSQNVFLPTSIASSLADPRSTSYPPCENKINQYISSVSSPLQTSIIDGKTTGFSERQEMPSQNDTNNPIKDGRVCSPKKTFVQSALGEGPTTAEQIERKHDHFQNTSLTSLASNEDKMLLEAEEAVADECSSIISRPNDGSKSRTIPRKKKKLPFKKRWPVLSAPKLNIIDFSHVLPPQDAIPNKLFTSEILKSPSAANVKTDATDSASGIKLSSFTNPKIKNPTSDEVHDKRRSNLNRLPAEVTKPLANVDTVSKTAGSTNVQRSSVAYVTLTLSKDQSTAVSIEGIPDADKSSRSVGSSNNGSLSAEGLKMEGLECSGPDVKYTSLASNGLRSSVNSAAKADPSSKDTAEASKLMTVYAPSAKCSSAASFKTTSPTNSAAATNESSSASAKAKSDCLPLDDHSHTAGKHCDAAHLDSEQLPEQVNTTTKSERIRRCGSHSSKGSLKEWQRQANLLWKMTLPHISQHFFNDPEMRGVRAVCDDLISHSGVTLSEPSSRVRARNAVQERQNLPENLEYVDKSEEYVEKLDGCCPEETHDRDTTDMSCSPSPKSNPGALLPFMGDGLLSPSKSLNDVNPDDETQLRSQHKSKMDAPSLEKDYSRDLDSFLDLSIASRSTAGKPNKPLASEPGCSRQASSDAGQLGPPFPAWWHREYSTPKHSFLEKESSSDDSMQVILPRSQVQRDENLIAPTPPGADDPFPHNYDPAAANRPETSLDTHTIVKRRSSTVITRILRKPVMSENQPDEHDFFLRFNQQSLFNPENDKKFGTDKI